MSQSLSTSKDAGPPQVTRPAVDPEITAIRKVVKLMEKAWKSNRTYSPTNPIAQKFFQQLFSELTEFLTSHQTLGFLVHRTELYSGGEVVYQTDEQGENLAFKLYSDGVRELAFQEGLSEPDLTFFLEALWGSLDQEDSDEDFVTRLWEKNLQTITCMTAGEVLQASKFEEVLQAQNSGTLNSPTSRLQEINETERSREEKEGGAEGKAKAKAKMRDQPTLVGYEVSQEELDALAVEIEAESTRDNTLYLLDMLGAILHSEKSSHLLNKLFHVLPGVLDSLTRQGSWWGLNTAAQVLQDTQEGRQDLSNEHKMQLEELSDSLGRPERIKAVEVFLNKNPDTSTEGLLDFLLNIKKHAVPSLCMLLGNLQLAEHRAVVSDALSVMAKDHPDPIVRGLSDRREQYLLDLLSVMEKLNDPRFVEPLEKLSNHSNNRIRKGVVRSLSTMPQDGNGTRLLKFLRDPDESVRHLALKALLNGGYTAKFGDWTRVVTDKGFPTRPVVEKRGIFQAMCLTTGEESIPFCEQLVTKWFLFNRKKNEELATLAIAGLGKLGTPSAVSVLQAGQQHRNRTIRQACSVALEALAKSGQGKSG